MRRLCWTPCNRVYPDNQGVPLSKRTGRPLLSYGQICISKQRSSKHFAYVPTAHILTCRPAVPGLCFYWQDRECGQSPRCRQGSSGRFLPRGSAEKARVASVAKYQR